MMLNRVMQRILYGLKYVKMGAVGCMINFLYVAC